MAVNKMKVVDSLSIEECCKKLAKLSKGLAHPVRVEQRPLNSKCVCGDIVDALPLSQASVSQHLKVLKECGWIRGDADGPRVCYCINNDIVEYFPLLFKKAIK